MSQELMAEKLMADLSDYMLAAAEEQKAREDYQGYSWGYAGERFIQQRIDAGIRFANSLNKYIDARIEAATGVARP